MENQPTPEQARIIEDESNCVIIAKPGTGKTLTLAYKIRVILARLPYYKGVAAISYTNKASDELELRSLPRGTDRKNSFFGTIDKFFITEIIIPFGDRVFGSSQREISVVKFVDLDPAQYHEYNPGRDDRENILFFRRLFQDGKILLEKVGFLASYLFQNSFACRRYIKAKYTHIIIDEYQDCDEWQHNLFLELVKLGLIGIAVGDLDQSIFAFANKSPEYLASLARENEIFRTYVLTTNHRCHISIVNYSTRLLSRNYIPQPFDEIRVFEKNIIGSEIEIAQWLTEAVPILVNRFDVEKLNKVGVLFKNRPTGQIIHLNIGLPHKPIINTPLDEDSSLWGSVFRKILIWAFSTEQTKHEFIECYLNIDFQEKTVLKVMGILRNLENIVSGNNALVDHIGLFEQIAQTIFPNAINNLAIANLRNVLSNQELLSSFVPPADDQIQLLTLHKAKGLEFDIVFHLNLYQWILPQYKGNYSQDLNLHYVGVTRAKKCCVLCLSSYRHRDQQIAPAQPSEFINLNNLDQLRLTLDI
jgi:superfamily I DNA/RNA helicase